MILFCLLSFLIVIHYEFLQGFAKILYNDSLYFYNNSLLFIIIIHYSL